MDHAERDTQGGDTPQPNAVRAQQFRLTDGKLQIRDAAKWIDAVPDALPDDWTPPAKDQ